MATPAHCLFCFETLAAKLDHYQAPRLTQVQDLWEQYQASQRAEHDQEDPDEDEEGTEDMNDEDMEGKEEASDPEAEEEEEDDDDDDEEEVEADETVTTSSVLTSRLQHLPVPVPSPSSGSSSSPTSSTSTPSSSRTLASTLASSTNSSHSSVASAAAARRGGRLDDHPSSSSSSSSLSVRQQQQQQRQQQPQEAMAAAEQDRPLFVSWNTVNRSGSKSLRGCIGTFEPQALETGLRNYALTSAFEDSRFLPITKRELKSLEVGVTLLTDFEPAPDPLDWEIGTHGIRLSFHHRGRRYTATYLPDVALEQGWNQEETLISLMRKAGWSGSLSSSSSSSNSSRGGGSHKDEWRKTLLPTLKVVRYRGRKCSMNVHDWEAWREWVDARGGVH